MKICSDRMKNGKDISFEIPVPVLFKTQYLAYGMEPFQCNGN